jgi:hypothetical protein
MAAGKLKQNSLGERPAGASGDGVVKNIFLLRNESAIAMECGSIAPIAAHFKKVSHF